MVSSQGIGLVTGFLRQNEPGRQLSRREDTAAEEAYKKQDSPRRAWKNWGMRSDTDLGHIVSVAYDRVATEANVSTIVSSAMIRLFCLGSNKKGNLKY
jgi:hypothetical protein